MQTPLRFNEIKLVRFDKKFIDFLIIRGCERSNEVKLIKLEIGENTLNSIRKTHLDKLSLLILINGVKNDKLNILDLVRFRYVKLIKEDK